MAHHTTLPGDRELHLGHREPGGHQTPRRLKETANKIKQVSLELYVSSRPSQKLHFERLGNYINEAFSLTFFFMSSNFVTIHWFIVMVCWFIVSLLHKSFYWAYMQTSHVEHPICNSVLSSFMVLTDEPEAQLLSAVRGSIMLLTKTKVYHGEKNSPDISDIFRRRLARIFCQW